MAKKTKTKRTPAKKARTPVVDTHETVAGPPPVLPGQQVLPGVPPVTIDLSKPQPPTVQVPMGAAVVITGAPAVGGGSGQLPPAVATAGTVAAAQAPITGQITTTVPSPAPEAEKPKRKRRPVASAPSNGNGSAASAPEDVRDKIHTGYHVELRGTVNDMLIAEAQSRGISWDRAGQIIAVLVEEALLSLAGKGIDSTVMRGASVVAIKEAVKEATKAIDAASAALHEIVGPSKPAPVDEPPPDPDFEEAYLARAEGRI